MRRLRWSTAVFRRTAEITPIGSPRSTDRSMALTASSMVWGRNCLISLITGRVVTGEVPRSPRRRSAM